VAYHGQLDCYQENRLKPVYSILVYWPLHFRDQYILEVHHKGHKILPLHLIMI